MNVQQSDVLPKFGIRQRLGEIKSMLISRNCKTQVKAASYLLKILENDVAEDAKNTTMADIILKEDTISFLCEAMATTDCSLLEKLVAIFYILSMSEEMAKQRDILCVAEATLRAAHFLAPLTSSSDGSQAANRVHAAALRLLAVILRRWTSVHKGRPVSEACRPEQLFSCVKNIYVTAKHDQSSGEQSTAINSCPSSPPIILLAAADALSAMMAAIAEETRIPPAVNINFSDSKSLNWLIILVFDGIQALEGEDALEIMCKLTEAAVKYSNLLFTVEGNSDLIQNVNDRESFVFFKEVVERFVINVIDTKKYLSHHHKTLCVVSVLNVTMEVALSSAGKIRSMLAQKLALKGFLAILPDIMHVPDDTKGIVKNLQLLKINLIPHDDCFRNLLSSNERNRPKVIGQSCGSRLLVSILTVLASDLLPESPFFEAQKLAAAVSALPNNVNDWGRLIGYHNSGAEVRAFVLVWAYCLCLCCDGFQSVELLVLTVLPHLSSYLCTFPKPQLMGMAIVKVIWLVFAVLSLYSANIESDTVKVDRNIIEKACERLVTVLLSQKSLKPAYSHNPALLYWTFTTDCPKIQRDVIILWLEHEDSTVALGDLVRTKREAAFLLLDVIQVSCDVVTTRGATLLEMALTCSESVDQPEEQKLSSKERFHLAATIWSILPSVLSRSTQSELDHVRSGVFLSLAYRAVMAVSGSDGGDCKDVLAAEKVFGGCEVRTACHLATLLASYTDFSRPCPVFQLKGLQLALLLLRFSQHRTDPRVFTMFAGHKTLSKVLLSSVISENQREPSIALSSVQLLTTMLKCQKFFCIFPDTECAMINADELLRLLESRVDISAALVELLQARFELRSKSEQPLLQLDNTTPSFWRALFLRLQMICAKDVPEMSLPAWTCMTLLLTSEICDSATCRHLATQPWTHLLLRAVLSSGPSKLASALQPRRTGADITVKTPPQEIVRFILAWLQATRESNHRSRTTPTPDLLTETYCVLGNALFHWTSKKRHCNNNERAIAQEILSCGAFLPSEVIDNIRKILSFPQNASALNE